MRHDRHVEVGHAPLQRKHRIEQREHALRLVRQGVPYTEVGRRVGVHGETVGKWARDARRKGE